MHTPQPLPAGTPVYKQILVGLLIQRYWPPSPEAFVCTIIHSAVVGASVGAVTVLANPKWLSNT